VGKTTTVVVARRHRRAAPEGPDTSSSPTITSRRSASRSPFTLFFTNSSMSYRRSWSLSLAVLSPGGHRELRRGVSLTGHEGAARRFETGTTSSNWKVQFFRPSRGIKTSGRSRSIQGSAGGYFMVDERLGREPWHERRRPSCGSGELSNEAQGKPEESFAAYRLNLLLRVSISSALDTTSLSKSLLAA